MNEYDSALVAQMHMEAEILSNWNKNILFIQKGCTVLI